MYFLDVSLLAFYNTSFVKFIFLNINHFLIKNSKNISNISVRFCEKNLSLCIEIKIALSY